MLIYCHLASSFRLPFLYITRPLNLLLQLLPFVNSCFSKSNLQNTLTSIRNRSICFILFSVFYKSTNRQVWLRPVLINFKHRIDVFYAFGCFMKKWMALMKRQWKQFSKIVSQTSFLPDIRNQKKRNLFGLWVFIVQNFFRTIQSTFWTCRKLFSLTLYYKLKKQWIFSLPKIVL